MLRNDKESMKYTYKMGESGSLISDGILLILLLLFFGILGGYYLRKNNCIYLHEAGLTTLIGVIFGLLLELFDLGSTLQPVTRLNVEFFLLILLPPIIFESGYNMNKVTFFANFGSICAYAFIGTLLSTIVVSILLFLVSYVGEYGLTISEAFAFGSLISATDPVSVLAIMKDLHADKILYTLIFGESIFNDAVTISLYRTIIVIKEAESSIQAILASSAMFFVIFGGSFIIGALVALIVSYILKRASSVRNRTDLEATAVVFGPWVSYLVSEGFTMSGIVSILFCGIFMARYTYPNLSQSSRAMVKKMYAAMAHAAETVVFLFLGLGLFSFNLPYEKMGIWLFLAAVVIIHLGRAVNVITNSWLLSLTGVKISAKFQIFMWYSGLRGAIAFALAINSLKDFENGDIILSMTVIYAIFTILVIGGTIVPLIKRLGVLAVDKADEEEEIFGIKLWIAKLEKTYLYPLIVNTSFGHQIMESERPERLDESDIDSAT